MLTSLTIQEGECNKVRLNVIANNLSPFTAVHSPINYEQYFAENSLAFCVIALELSLSRV